MAWRIGARLARLPAAVAFAAPAFAACGNPSTSPAVGAAPPVAAPMRASASATIKHVVIVVQENRSFDNLFATFPGADGATSGLMKVGDVDVTVPLRRVPLAEPCDFGHGYHGFLKNYDGGKMDGFALTFKCNGNHSVAYQYVDPAQIRPYWTLARQYVLADQMFQTQGSGSFTAHQDLIAGATILNPQQTISLVDFPSAAPWGCDAPPGTKTATLTASGSRLIYRFAGGPFPCVTYRTLRDLLDAKSVSWKYYSPPIVGASGAIWNAFDAIEAVRYSSEWQTNVTRHSQAIFSDIAQGRLPAVSWLIPDRDNSDHPFSPKYDGPSWVASVVNAIGESSYWTNTAIVIVWDDWGGFYDHVPPPLRDHWGGLGLRVPMIVVSAYAPRGTSGGSYVSHTQYEFGSILRFVEETFALGSLGTTDLRANSIADCFDFAQQPRPFHRIRARHSETYFVHERPSGLPVDSE